MSDLTIFEIVAGTASILALLLVVIGFTWKTLLAYKQMRQSAERELERELTRLQSAGRTVSARSDLGFLVLIELGSLRESASRFRHFRTLYLVFTAFAFGFLVIVSRDSVSHGLTALIIIILGVVSIGTMIMVIVNHIIAMLLARYIGYYERRIKEVWSSPVGRRSDTSIGPTTESS